MQCACSGCVAYLVLDAEVDKVGVQENAIRRPKTGVVPEEKARRRLVSAVVRVRLYSSASRGPGERWCANTFRDPAGASFTWAAGRSQDLAGYSGPYNHCAHVPDLHLIFLLLLHPSLRRKLLLLLPAGRLVRCGKKRASASQKKAIQASRPRRSFGTQAGSHSLFSFGFSSLRAPWDHERNRHILLKTRATAEIFALNGARSSRTF